MMKAFLMSWQVLTATSACLGQSNPPTTKIYDAVLFGQLEACLKPGNLLKVYASQLQLECAAPLPVNFQGTLDSVLVIKSGSDQLKLFKNTHVGILLKANLRSNKMDFGQGIRIGCSKRQFCAALHLSEKYTVYCLANSPSNSQSCYLYFYFQGELLSLVSYINQPKLDYIEQWEKTRGCM